MIETGSQNANIEITMNGSQQSDSVFPIKQYLIDRLAEGERKGLPFDGSKMVIDIGVLGISVGTKSATRNWEGKIVYPIRLYHSSLILGPVYSSAKGGPCPSCLERRWLALRPSEEQLAIKISKQTLIFGNNPRLIPFTLESIWAVVESMLSQRPASALIESSEGRLFVLDLDTLQLTQHLLIADSLCPECSVPALDTPQAAVIQLSSRIKREFSAYHLIEATDYKLPFAGYENSLCGLLGSKAPPDYTHTVNAPVTGMFKTWGKYYPFDAWWSGHGNSYHLSRYLAVLEGLERYSGLRPRAKEVSVFDSYENLLPDALNPIDCGAYRPDYYRKHFPFYLPFSPERKIYWVWGYSFGKARPILVPEQMVYYLDYRIDQSYFVQDCSNGCASGSCIEEATLFGLLELIERDAFLIAWYAKLALPRIDPRSCCNLDTLFVLDCIDKLGYDMHLFDMRLDLKIPSVMGLAVRREKGLGQLVFAAGASLDPEDAIRAALCEVASYVSGFDHRVALEQETLRAMIQDYSKVTKLSHHSLLYGLPEMAGQADFLFQNSKLHSVDKLYGEWMIEWPQSLDLLDDLRYCLNEILNLEMDVIVVDQTCPEQERVGLKTVCVIVPGLIPIDFGWEQQRALDMPRLRTVPRTAEFLDAGFDPTTGGMAPHPFP